MNKIGLFLITGLIVFVMGCNNTTDQPTGNKVVKTEADSLLDEVMDGHDVGMAKMGAMMRARKKATELLDSISKLPAKAQTAAAPYKAKLNGVLSDLTNAEESMNKWMNEFEMDSAINNVKERVRYLGTEKVKVGAMKEAIVGSLQKADSLFRKF